LAEEIKIIKIKDYYCFRIRDMVFVNEKLEEQNPKLYAKAIEHERKHSASYKFKDVFMDLKPEGTFFQSIAFMYKNPRALKQFIPFFVWEGHLYIDYTLMFLYSALLLLLVVFI
jgi:hypothetical protein